MAIGAVFERSLLGASAVCIVVAAAVFVADRLEERRAAEASNRTVPSSPEYANRGFSRGERIGQHAVVVFTDFGCTACRSFALVIDSFIQRNPSVRVVERHLPAAGQTPSYSAAMAAECAADFGRYASMRDELFRRPLLVAHGEWGLVAALAGIQDSSALRECVSDRHHAADVDADIRLARRIGLASRPSLMVDSLVVGRRPSVATLESLVRRIFQTK